MASPGRIIWRQLHWQRSLDPDAALALLRGLASDGRSRRIVLETRARAGRTSYLLGADPADLPGLERSLAALASGSRLLRPELERTSVQTARQVKASTRHRAVRGDDPLASARQLLAALTAVNGDELLVLQLVLGPRRVPLAIPTSSQSSLVSPWWVIALHGNGQTIDSEKRSALRDKVADHGFACALRIGVTAATAGRRRGLVLGVLAALRAGESPGLQLRQATSSPARLNAGAAPAFVWPLRLGVREVLSLTAWPFGDTDLPGQPPLHPRPLPPAPGTTGSRRVVALASAPGVSAKLALPASAALHHAHVIGPTGVGKSNLLARLIEQDIADGRAVVLIEPKGDLVDDVLAHVPAHRQRDVVVLDPRDASPVGINPLAVPGRRPEVLADGVLSVFRALYADAWGPRTQDILHAGLLTLAQRDDASIVMLPLLLTNPGFRRSLTAGLRDQLALGPFWAWYENLSDAERGAVIAPVMNKLRAWLLNGSVRALLGQREPRFTLRQVFTERRILLVPLQGGVIGEEAARLLGSLVLAQLWQAIQGRAAIPRERRHPVMVYVDEVQDYLHLPTDLGDALAQARGLGVGFTLAHQYLDQLPTTMRAAVLANARSRVCFQLGNDDALRLSKGHPELTPGDLTQLGEYEVYASLFAGGRVTPYAIGRTLPPGPPSADPFALRAASRAAYGRPLDEIEAGFAELLDLGSPQAPTGRKRRTP